MSRTTTALLALSAVVLTGCGPTTDEVTSMVTAGATTYEDALELREDIIAAGLQCPGTDQRVVPAEDGIAYLECDNGMMAMAVASSNEDMQELVSSRNNTGPGATPVLHAANWMVVARDEAPLQQLQTELGGTIIPVP
ncbi:hypothetical protein AUQ48_17145 [Kocuria flava]|uniref:Lipoprotein n=1 Tax=Kocuria flava TaxID=446860 RepID=A0A2N4SXS4_9MICC|nr:hypothetical protein [Kocuria flava]PLC10773.1 hypothetical protein AUQ48_17145 [Kocuria flava]